MKDLTNEGQEMIIWDAELVNDSENCCTISGQVTHVAEDCIEIACGIGKLLLHGVAISGYANSPLIWIKSIRKRLS
jgi:methionyl-tRNA formyltransferase